MRSVRAYEAEQAFEEHWARLQETHQIVADAHLATRRGRTDEVRACLARLRQLAPEKVAGLQAELAAVAEAVRRHPSWRGPRSVDL